MKLIERITHERLGRICHCDYARQIVLVAVQPNTQSGSDQILGVARLNKLHGENAGRITLLVSDMFQGQGLGEELVERLIHVGRTEKLDWVEALFIPDNKAMQAIVNRLGFSTSSISDGKMLRATLTL
jgi:acetyltransferase